jgi:hypothetical protein
MIKSIAFKAQGSPRPVRGARRPWPRKRPIPGIFGFTDASLRASACPSPSSPSHEGERARTTLAMASGSQHAENCLGTRAANRRIDRKAAHGSIVTIRSRPGWQRKSDEESLGLGPYRDAEGFITVFPGGVDNAWNAGGCCSQTPTDVEFVREAIAYLNREACIDTKRVLRLGLLQRRRHVVQTGVRGSRRHRRSGAGGLRLRRRRQMLAV